MSREIEKIIIATLVVTILAFFLFPIFWIISMSFKTVRQILSVPPVWFFMPTLDNYKELFTGHFMGGQIFPLFFPNSLICAVCSTGLAIVVSVFAAHSLARFNYRGRTFLGFFIISLRLLPPIGMVIPLFLMMGTYRLLDTRLALVLVYTCFNIPLTTWILKGFIETVPRELEECARIDGCSQVSALIRIVFPLILPGVAAVAILCLLLAWNDFTLALFLTSSTAKTLPVALGAFQTEQQIFWGHMAAMGVIMMLPVIFFILFAQKYMIKGLTLGGVK